jgi:flagellar basal-body rod protein FlgB
VADFLIDETAAFLRRTLDGSAARQHVLADNIANATTPGYTRKTLDFEDNLRQAMESSTSDPSARIAAIEHTIIEQRDDIAAPRRADGNNVDMEREMVEIAKNSGQYERSAQLLMMKLRGLKSAVRSGR